VLVLYWRGGEIMKNTVEDIKKLLADTDDPPSLQPMNDCEREAPTDILYRRHRFTRLVSFKGVICITCKQEWFHRDVLKLTREQAEDITNEECPGK
jgi:hypothetical protein